MSRTRWIHALLIGALPSAVVLGGCAMSDKADKGSSINSFGNDETASEPQAHLIRVDVLPSDVLRVDGSFRVFPQTVGPLDMIGSASVAVGTVQLASPVELFGTVRAEQVTPVAAGAELPAVLSTIPATVNVRRADTVQNYQTEADVDGAFTTLVVPNVEYEVQVVPEDPEIPFIGYSYRPGTTPQAQELEIGYGAAIFGRVLDGAGRPIEGAYVHAEDAAGLAGAAARSSADGIYLLRVSPGEYTVVSEGRQVEPDPVLRSEPFEVTAEGVAHDVVYARLDTWTVSGAVIGADGAPLKDVSVRLTATALDGYADVDAALVLDDTTNSAGGFQRTVPPGTYRIEVLPPTTDDVRNDHTPLLVDEVDVLGPVNMGSMGLEPLIPIGGQVLDEQGDPIREARVICEEVGFGQRQWAIYTGNGGEWSLDLPAVDVTCTLVPPGNRLDLALTRETVDPSVQAELDLQFRSGTRVFGAVHYAGEPEPFAVVEVRDPDGVLMGSALTNDEGAFELFVTAP